LKFSTVVILDTNNNNNNNNNNEYTCSMQFKQSSNVPLLHY